MKYLNNFLKGRKDKFFETYKGLNKSLKLSSVV